MEWYFEDVFVPQSYSRPVLLIFVLSRYVSYLGLSFTVGGLFLPALGGSWLGGNSLSNTTILFILQCVWALQWQIVIMSTAGV